MSEIQKPAESAANNSNAALLLSAIVDSSDDAIISKDLDGVITSWNRSSERIFGYTAKEAIGQTVAALLIPADRQEEEPKILARLRSGERVDHFETVRRRKDGSLLDISLTISPVKDPGGKIIGISKIARDITEPVRARAEITQLAERLRLTLTSIGDAVVATDANGAVTYLNPLAEELTGWPLADATGKPLPQVFRIINEETRETVENPVSKVLREGRIVGLANHTVLIARSGQEYAIDDSAGAHSRQRRQDRGRGDGLPGHYRSARGGSDQSFDGVDRRILRRRHYRKGFEGRDYDLEPRRRADLRLFSGAGNRQANFDAFRSGKAG